MAKWDALVLFLQDQGMTDFLKTIYTNTDQVTELNRDIKSMLLSTAKEWNKNNPNLQKEIIK